MEGLCAEHWPAAAVRSAVPVQARGLAARGHGLVEPVANAVASCRGSGDRPALFGSGSPSRSVGVVGWITSRWASAS